MFALKIRKWVLRVMFISRTINRLTKHILLHCELTPSTFSSLSQKKAEPSPPHGPKNPPTILELTPMIYYSTSNPPQPNGKTSKKELADNIASKKTSPGPFS
ncbi:hypothetical protein CEXT_206821 [Caerostris extrusa]|uniref:Uncharacterized protein n=1 Tax=Caerostris extrusa TaxID=172846 RepID=A0AAV4R9G0_CAEEX|nr:hypothetical protein CEXT_206821 [Caerostris extrusa]